MLQLPFLHLVRNPESINQSINQSWIYIAHTRKASNALNLTVATEVKFNKHRVSHDECNRCLLLQQTTIYICSVGFFCTLYKYALYKFTLCSCVLYYNYPWLPKTQWTLIRSLPWSLQLTGHWVVAQTVHAIHTQHTALSSHHCHQRRRPCASRWASCRKPGSRPSSDQRQWPPPSASSCRVSDWSRHVIEEPRLPPGRRRQRSVDWSHPCRCPAQWKPSHHTMSRLDRAVGMSGSSWQQGHHHPDLLHPSPSTRRPRRSCITERQRGFHIPSKYCTTFNICNIHCTQLQLQLPCDSCSCMVFQPVSLQRLPWLPSKDN